MLDMRMTASYKDGVNRADRTKILSLRLKPEEHGRLVAEAEAMYLPLSAYVRHRLFGEKTWRGAGRRKGKRK